MTPDSDTVRFAAIMDTAKRVDPRLAWLRTRHRSAPPARWCLRGQRAGRGHGLDPGRRRAVRGGRLLNDGLSSPVNGDFAGFPPVMITTGTRDLLLSDGVRTHRKLRQAKVDAQLQVFEAQSHAQFLLRAAPETAEAFAEIASFFNRHLAR